MKRVMAVKKILIFLCACIIIVSGCQAQTQKAFCELSRAAFSQTVLQMPKVHTHRPDMLDEGQWLDDDDDASHVSIHDKKTMFVRRNTLHLFMINALLAGGLAVLFAYVAAQVSHSSSCPTHGLSRILAFILRADGQKDNSSFSF